MNTKTEQKRVRIFAVSDGTGETVDRIINAVLLQYGGQSDVRIVRYKSIRTVDQVDTVLDEAKKRGAILVYTIVMKELRSYLEKSVEAKGIPAVDLFGELLELFNKHIGKSTTEQPGLLHQVNEEYYRRIEAMEFTVKHDDGSNIDNLMKADIILVGISRTSKTPLSIFLSHKGYKVANVPLVRGIEPPESLFQIDQKKIVGLTIQADALVNIRRERMRRMGHEATTDYCNYEKIQEEVEWAQQIFSRNRKWPVFDVTNKALEETAADIERRVFKKYRLNEFETA